MRTSWRRLRDFTDPPWALPAGSAIRPSGYTRLGAALRHVTKGLMAAPAERRVLLSIGDGIPSDEGYEGTYAEADVRQAMDGGSTGRRDHRPYYVAAGTECEAVLAACAGELAVMLTGPTGCGKTRLVRHTAVVLDRPLVTVSCHDELTASDLLGRYLVVGGDVRWMDGPLTTAVRQGAVCYLDEVAEARRDTLAVLHSLLDDRRELYLDRTGETVRAADGFVLMASWARRYTPP